ncbi:hypothetical protein CH52_01395 [Staphylococcus aureus]|nr:hypothetical protein CH52_01395 [Staphylococcus aureus]
MPSLSIFIALIAIAPNATKPAPAIATAPPKASTPPVNTLIAFNSANTTGTTLAITGIKILKDDVSNPPTILEPTVPNTRNILAKFPICLWKLSFTFIM